MSIERDEGNEPIEGGTELVQDTPRIYVADLAAYNNGYLHGTWLGAAQEPPAIWKAIKAMLARSPIAGAEEIAIHDYDNFGPLALSEYESIETISRIGQGFAEHGAAFLHWVNYIGTSDPDGFDRFEDVFLGTYQSIRDLGEELAVEPLIDRALDEHLPDFIRPYVSVDYESFGRDAASSLHVAERSGELFVFDP